MREKCNRLAFVPAVYLLAVLCAWSWWSHETTGKWTHVANMLSFGGINLCKGNNEFVEALYPEVHMNALDYAGLTDRPRDIQDKAWTVNDHFRQLAPRYLSSDWWHALRFLWFKTYAVFFAITSYARITVQEPISVDQLRDLATLRNEKTLKVHVLAIGYGLYKRTVHRLACQEEAYGIRVDVRCSSLCVALRSFRNRPCPTVITWWCCIA